MPFGDVTTRNMARFGANILLSAKALGVGGPAWTISRPASSDGVSAPGSPTAPGSITGYVLSPEMIRLAATLSGTSIPLDKWRLYAATSQDVRIGDKITSQADATLKFIVQSKETLVNTTICGLEPA